MPMASEWRQCVLALVPMAPSQDTSLPADSQRLCGHCPERQSVFVEDRPGHDRRYAIDSSRVRKEFGWRPTVDLHEGPGRTVRWYLRNRWWWQRIGDRGFEDSRRQGRPDT